MSFSHSRKLEKIYISTVLARNLKQTAYTSSAWHNNPSIYISIYVVAKLQESGSIEDGSNWLAPAIQRVATKYFLAVLHLSRIVKHFDKKKKIVKQAISVQVHIGKF